MKYLRQFSTESEYLDFKEAPDYITPNVSFITDSETVMYNEYVEPPISLCDIAYWDGSSVKTVSKDKWNSSLGTAIGVVVIPKGMLPDGKARMISLSHVDSNGDAVESVTGMKWGSTSTDTPLTNYTKVPTTDNAGSTSTGTDSLGRLPSDKFTGAQSYVDPKAKYYGSTPYIPSPYLGDDKTLNPEYCKEISGYNNALSDFNGLSNTETLVGLGTDYVAANACWKYSDGVSNTQWYLPAMGELGFLMVRFNEINAAITAVGGTAVSGSDEYRSSSECSSFSAYFLGTNNGVVYDFSKANTYCVRPLAIIGNNIEGASLI